MKQTRRIRYGAALAALVTVIGITAAVSQTSGDRDLSNPPAALVAADPELAANWSTLDSEVRARLFDRYTALPSTSAPLSEAEIVDAFARVQQNITEEAIAAESGGGRERPDGVSDDIDSSWLLGRGNSAARATNMYVDPAGGFELVAAYYPMYPTESAFLYLQNGQEKAYALPAPYPAVKITQPSPGGPLVIVDATTAEPLWTFNAATGSFTDPPGGTSAGGITVTAVTEAPEDANNDGRTDRVRITINFTSPFAEPIDITGVVSEPAPGLVRGESFNTTVNAQVGANTAQVTVSAVTYRTYNPRSLRSLQLLSQTNPRHRGGGITYPLTAAITGGARRLAITPRVACVTPNTDGSLTARFSWTNNEGTELTSDSGVIADYSGTALLPTPDQYDRFIFTVDGSEPYVGVQAFPIPEQRFSPTGTATWTLADAFGSATATADRSSQRCPKPGTLRVGALFSTSPTNPGITISGSAIQVTGRVHSESSISLSASTLALTAGTEYATTFNSAGSAITINPAQTQTPPGQTPDRPLLADYRPGGAEAVIAGSTYTQIPTSACSNGTWNPTPQQLVNGNTYFTTCNVNIGAANLTRTVTIASDGAISVSGALLTLSPTVKGGPLLIAGTNINLNASTTKTQGSLTATQDITISGSALQACQLTGRRITINTSGSTFINC